MIAVIFTIGIWFRIDIIYIPGYGILYSSDWWALYAAIALQVTSVIHLHVYMPVINSLYQFFLSECLRFIVSK